MEAERGTGRPRAPEQWPENSGKGLNNQLQVDAIALLWAEVVERGLACPGSFLEVQGRAALQNGGLRALREVWSSGYS